MLLSFIMVLISSVECEPEDHECNAKQFERMAATTKDPQRRISQLYAAHRAYIARFDQTGSAKHLCAARQTFDQGIAIDGQTDDQRAAFTALREGLTVRERKSGAICSTKTKRRKETLASALGRPSEAASTPTPDEPHKETVASPPPNEPSAPAGQPTDTRLAARTVEPESITPPRGAAATQPVTTASAPAPHITDLAARRRVKAGLATLLPGLLLLAPTAGVLAFRGNVRADWDALRVTTMGRSPTPNEETTALELNKQFRGSTAAAAVLGATGAALVITGAILLATGRRSTRVAVGPWGVRGLSGLAIQGRF